MQSGFKVRTVRPAAESNVRSLNIDDKTLSNGGVRQTTSRASRSMALRDKRHACCRQLFELGERGEGADHSYNSAEVMQPISWYGPYLALHIRCVGLGSGRCAYVPRTSWLVARREIVEERSAQFVVVNLCSISPCLLDRRPCQVYSPATIHPRIGRAIDSLLYAQRIPKQSHYREPV